MNDIRRRKIAEIKDRIESLFSELTCGIKDELQSLLDEERKCYDAMPEPFRDGEGGEIAQVVIDAIQSAIGELEELYSDEITSHLDKAREFGR